MKLDILLALILIDNFVKFRSNYKSYQDIYSLLDASYSRSSIRGQIGSLLKEGRVEKILKNGDAYFSLTNRGFTLFTDSLLGPYRAIRTAWDGKWRIVIFDISERERNAREKVRQILKKSRFGRLSNSIYITPFNNHQQVLQQARDLFGNNLPIFVFEANKSSIENKRTALMAFHLDQLKKNYTDWISKAKKNLSREDKIKILEEYFDILLKRDPGLPAVLLPEEWPLVSSWKIFIGLLEKSA